MHAISVLDGQEGLHARLAARRRVRQLPAGIRRADSRAAEGLRRAAGGRPAEGAAGRADRGAARLGLPLVGVVGADVARGLLGRRAVARASQPTREGEDVGRLRFIVGRDAASRCSRRSPPRRDKLTADFGTLEDAVGRHQPLPAPHRRHRAAVRRRGAEHPRGFTSARWGSLASFGARAYPGTKKWYGTSGNSFVAVVEFGDRVRARAVTAGGESGDPASPHFNDQAKRYATGESARGLLLSRSARRGTSSASITLVSE